MAKQPTSHMSDSEDNTNLCLTPFVVQDKSDDATTSLKVSQGEGRIGNEAVRSP